jgi:hypothetical protein
MNETDTIDKLVEIASLMVRGQLTQPRKVGAEIRKIAMQLRAERDAAARDLTVARQIIHDLTDGITGTLQSDAVEAAAREMRERCAKVADEYDSDNANDISERIRALPSTKELPND